MIGQQPRNGCSGASYLKYALPDTGVRQRKAEHHGHHNAISH
jgi:hypothetical protein